MQNTCLTERWHSTWLCSPGAADRARAGAAKLVTVQRSGTVQAHCWGLICGRGPVSCRAAVRLTAAEGVGPGRAVQSGECIAANRLLHQGQLHPAAGSCAVPLQQLGSADALPCMQRGRVQPAGDT